MKDPIPAGYFDKGGMADPIPAGYFQGGGNVGFRRRTGEAGDAVSISGGVGYDLNSPRQTEVPSPPSAPPQAVPATESTFAPPAVPTDGGGYNPADTAAASSINTGGWTTADGQFLGEGTSFLEDRNWETTQAGVDFSSTRGNNWDPNLFTSNYGGAQQQQQPTGGGFGSLVASYASLGPQIPLPGGGSVGLLPGQGLASLATSAFNLDEADTVAGRQQRDADEARLAELGEDWSYDRATGQFSRQGFTGTEAEVNSQIAAEERRQEEARIAAEQAAAERRAREQAAYDAQHSGGAGGTGYGGHAYSINTGGSDESFLNNNNWETTSGGVDYSANTGSNWDPNQFTSNYGGDSGGGGGDSGGK